MFKKYKASDNQLILLIFMYDVGKNIDRYGKILYFIKVSDCLFLSEKYCKFAFIITSYE